MQSDLARSTQDKSTNTEAADASEGTDDAKKTGWQRSESTRLPANVTCDWKRDSDVAGDLFRVLQKSTAIGNGLSTNFPEEEMETRVDECNDTSSSLHASRNSRSYGSLERLIRFPAEKVTGSGLTGNSFVFDPTDFGSVSSVLAITGKTDEDCRAREYENEINSRKLEDRSSNSCRSIVQVPEVSVIGTTPVVPNKLCSMNILTSRVLTAPSRATYTTAYI